jgi:hypothetical protein
MEENSIGLEPEPKSKRIAIPGRYVLLIGLLLALLVLFGFIINRATRGSGTSQMAGELLSEQALAEKYGVQVNLIAVTAAGGLVDLRLKILDAEKARLLLQESSDVPKLRIGEDEALLIGPEDAADQILSSLEDDAPLFLMYPNVAGVLEPGKLVTVQFGEIWLEPVPAQ